jgi:hypothetical protein
VSDPVASIEIRIKPSNAKALIEEMGGLVPRAVSEYEPAILELIGKRGF